MTQIPKMDGRMARFVIDDLRRRRIPVDGLLKEVGLRKTDLANPEARLPHASAVFLIEGAARLVGDANYGLRLGASRDTRERGLLGFLSLNSPTLMDALINLQRFYKIVRESGEFEVERNGAQVAIRFRETDPALRGLRHNSGFIVATFVRVCRDLARQAISPIRVEFVGEEPDSIAEYTDILGCPVKFGAEWTTLVYAEETTRLPVKGADEKLLRILEAACQDILGPTPKAQDLVHDVRQLIVERLPGGAFNIDAIADELNMSSNTGRATPPSCSTWRRSPGSSARRRLSWWRLAFDGVASHPLAIPSSCRRSVRCRPPRRLENGARHHRDDSAAHRAYRASVEHCWY